MPKRAESLFSREVLGQAVLASLAKLDPRVQIRNPVMFVVEIGATITTFGWLVQVVGGPPLGGGSEPAWYTFVLAVWLWLTVVFANLAEALAEGIVTGHPSMPEFRLDPGQAQDVISYLKTLER